jgi:Phycobilisome protein
MIDSLTMALSESLRFRKLNASDPRALIILDPMAPPQFSPAVLALITKARIVSFATWTDTHSPKLLQLLQTADDERRYLTDQDLQEIKPQHDSLAITLWRDQVTEIVDEARAEVLRQFPGITQPGGGLYPPERATACWRDFWQFLRCVTYGVAGGRVDYTSEIGLDYMNQLYRELQVPLPAMVVGLQALKAASLRRLEGNDSLGLYFDRLITDLQKFT